MAQLKDILAGARAKKHLADRERAFAIDTKERERSAQDLTDFNVKKEETYGSTPGTRLYQQSAFEKRAGVSAPEFEGSRDVRTGELLSPFKTDAYGGEALQELKKQAFSQGESPWAKMQLQGQKLEEQGSRDRLLKEQMQSAGQAQSQLARSGGLTGGARTLLARQSQRDLLGASQGLSRQGMGQRLDIAKEDIARKEGLLGKFGDLETQAQASNIGQLTGDITRRGAFEGERYGAQMAGYGAAQSAQAQRDAAAASKPKSGCCFIFMEARYGDGTLDNVVRKYRDEKMTEQNRRGYYKLSEVLVPLMRKSKIVKFLVRALMTDPMVNYGKYYYGENKFGFIFAPVKNLWLKTFNLLGSDTKFIRENGEVI